MDFRDKVENEYFEWMYNLVCGDRFERSITYRKLLTYLHNTEFIWLIPRDRNRASDGQNLRLRFASGGSRYNYNQDYIDVLSGRPCSVLEMMIALAIRCEETIMDDPRVGDRTGQWFWSMIANLGLGSMIDSRFDKSVVIDIVDRFLNRDYEPNGKGGLFTIRDCDQDLRTVEIWYQLCWFLDSIA